MIEYYDDSSEKDDMARMDREDYERSIKNFRTAREWMEELLDQMFKEGGSEDRAIQCLEELDTYFDIGWDFRKFGECKLKQ